MFLSFSLCNETEISMKGETLASAGLLKICEINEERNNPQVTGALIMSGKGHRNREEETGSELTAKLNLLMINSESGHLLRRRWRDHMTESVLEQAGCVIDGDLGVFLRERER